MRKILIQKNTLVMLLFTIAHVAMGINTTTGQNKESDPPRSGWKNWYEKQGNAL